MLYSTYLGGSLDAVDSLANTVVAGITYSADFTTTEGALQPKTGGAPTVSSQS